MPTTLIVLAHPEARSFNRAWADASATAMAAQGHEILWSDLCKIGFNPVEEAARYGHIGNVPFDPLKAQEAAAEAGEIPSDVAIELKKLKTADRLIFHFPIWWFAPPAILKGWFDRVLLHGEMHNVDERFDTGRCKSKSALFCVTTGSSAAESAHNGKEGNIQMLLWPAAHTLRYLGFSVLQPVITHGVHGYNLGNRLTELETRLGVLLNGHADTLKGWNTHPRLEFHSDKEFDDEGRLRPEHASFSPFITNTF